MAPSKFIMWDPCPLGMPERLTAAHTTTAVHEGWDLAEDDLLRYKFFQAFEELMQAL